MIKVAQCLAGAPYGGAENFFTRLVVALSGDPQLQQRVFTRDNEYRVSAIDEANVPVELFRFGSPWHWYNNFRYRQALKKYSPDVVLTYMNRASRLTPRGKYQLVCRLGHYYKLKNYVHADYWIGVSKGICKYMIANGFPEDRVVYIPNFAEEATPVLIPRESFATPVDCPLLLTAGRLHVNKGFDILLRALTNIPDAILWLAGDGPERESLRSLADELKIRHRVRFLGWRNDVTALMRSADLFVCPSRHEGLGSIVVESWCHGCPIVATASQGPSDLIEHGVTGLLSPIDEVEALQRNILSLLHDDKERKRLMDNSQLEYKNHFSQNVITNKYKNFFQEIASK